MFLAPADFVSSPEALQREWSRDQSLQYTRWLATSHYENFHVVSFLLPKHLHRDFFNVYAFCRWADDLGDEIGDPAESLRLLDWWRSELLAMYGGKARHPVYIALRETVDRHGIPSEPFEDLIKAFIQDQTVHEYETWEQLYGYCRYSANPVGRLVLHLCGYTDDRRRELSDATCTALQLANFWQDITVDLEKGRIYLPKEEIARAGYTVEELRARRFTPAFRTAMQAAVERTRTLFDKGLALPGMVDRKLAIDLDLFSRGGLEVLGKIEALDYDVLRQRPVITKLERVGLLVRSVLRHMWRAA